MRYAILFIAILMIASGPLYACCGGATWRQYESVSENSQHYQDALAASNSYLKLKTTGNNNYETARDQVIYSDATGGYWSGSFAAERLIAIICMYDNDYNYYISGTSSFAIGAEKERTRHAVCSVTDNCHLDQNTNQSARAALTCPHHECHWDYIEEQMPKYSSTADQS